MEWLDLEVEVLKDKVVLRPDMIKKGACGILKVMCSMVANNFSGEGIPVDGLSLRSIYFYLSTVTYY